MSVGLQLLWLVVLAIPIACISWTVTHEDVFRELREYFTHRSQHSARLWQRKFFYLFICEYCFSHYMTALFLIITRYKLLYEDWRGYLVAGFALVWVANLYMSLFGRLRLDIKKERVEIQEKEQQTTQRRAA
jgi:hypothetical protein